ncbi:hypothetical protein [Streptomyces sp. ME19-01-6]|uniref:hypothetical protein n=1 Tax=Streptomyces sp. ME19-01-6 TaxID=3028686 RepID=UPI0029B01C6E|nr:hypothetical protein [Streptomyces sp. ME19-01-6]MDX3224592.1 hypothetical protein [Streptomyces sp. ME19-01-6]
MTYSRGVQVLSGLIGVEPDHVARALRVAARNHASIRPSHFSHLTDEQFQRLINRDQHAVAVVANLAMRFAGRIEDAHLLMDVYRASVGATAHQSLIREGIGTPPQFHRHEYVQHAIRILMAADLPPIHIDGVRELKPGFQVDPAWGDMSGWVFIQPDPDAEGRSGFAGGHLGYLAVLRWAGWGVITVPLPGGLWAACHPDYRDKPFPS